MISANTKTNVKEEIQEVVAVSYNFSQKYLKYNIKQTCIFHLILV